MNGRYHPDTCRLSGLMCYARTRTTNGVLNQKRLKLTDEQVLVLKIEVPRVKRAEHASRDVRIVQSSARGP